MHLKDAKLIAIFTVLGLFLFGGGAYAIVDGWPYLVLERGFTQVIIGSIASSAGLILLSLAWILREVRALGRSLAEVAQMRAEPPPGVTAAERLRAPWEAPRPEFPAGMPGLVPAAAGAAVGAVAAGAAVGGLVSTSEKEEAAPAAEATPVAERDLFGALVAKQFEETELQPESGQTVPEVASEAPTEPLPDMFEDTSFAPREEAPEAPVAVETESHEAAEIVTAKIQPVGEDEALAHAAEPFPTEPASAAEDAGEPQAPAPMKGEPAKASSDLDEFSALRESLAGHLNEPLPSDVRIEPSLGSEEDPFAEAEAWMERASPRKEPWFETPAANEAEPSAAVAPPWPPRTEAKAEDEAKPETGAAAPSDAPAAEAAEAPAETAAVAEEASETEQPPQPERATSDEGIVGAYQVGDAHFTIFADGSIRARTPDGEFSFTSMDELKAYLASEKNRLGV